MSVLRRYRIGDSPKEGMKIVDLLGGGMGIVYVLDIANRQGGESGVRLALKSCPTESAMTEEGRAVFQREALTWLSLLPHPNVVRAMSFEIDGGLPAILMEFVPGGNLRSRIGPEGMPLSDCMRIAGEICEAMIFLGQTAGVVHRDLKPENILFTSEGSVKVTDFGISTVLAAAEAEGFSGTLPYMAPEQLQGRRDVDARADIFAFGVVLHEILSGRRPFDAPTPSDMREAHLSGARGLLSTSVPGPVRAIVERCLERRRGNRFRDFVELGEALAGACAACGLRDCMPPRVGPETLEAGFDANDWNNRGYAFRQLGDFEEALRCYRRSIEIACAEGETGNITVTPGADREHPSGAMGIAVTYDNLGMLLGRLGRLEEAQEAFEQALARVPDDGMAWFGLGQLALAERRHDEALSLFRKSVECEPGNSDLLLKYVRLCAALGRREEVEHGIALVLDRKRSDVPFLIAMGCFLGEELGPEVAARFLDTALATDPGSAAAWYNRGVCRHRQADVRGALAAYERALAAEPDHPYAHFYAGIAELLVGTRERGIRHLQAVAERGDLGPLGDFARLSVSGLTAGLPAESATAGFVVASAIKYVP
jgi:tetratricopeptide (TPR) repeat protein